MNRSKAPNANDRRQIGATLKKLQEGYDNRDLTQIERFMAEVFVRDDDLLVIGTSAVAYDSGEWCQGYDAVKALIEDDWKYWGDLKLDIGGARISFAKDTACVSLTGVISEVITSEDYYNLRTDLVKELLETDDLPIRTRLLEIVRGVSDTLYETEKGEQYEWPLRLSGVMQRHPDRWLFTHMHFSYPTTFYPRVRF